MSRLALLFAALTILAVGSCGAEDGPISGGAGPRREASERPGETKIVGVIVAVDSAGLNEVNSFTVRHDGKNSKLFVDSETEFAFTPSHLQEHLATSELVRVETVVGHGKTYARFVDDAKSPHSH